MSSVISSASGCVPRFDVMSYINNVEKQIDETPFVRVYQATTDYDLFVLEQGKHLDADLKIKSLDVEINNLIRDEMILFGVINVWVDEDYPQEVIDDGNKKLQQLHGQRMGLYIPKEQEKGKRKKAYHSMKRLSYTTPDRCFNTEFKKAYEYFQQVSK